MTGEKKSSDLSNRLKRPLKSSSRASKSPARTPSGIIAPPKAAIPPSKPKKADLHRRKNPFNEMLRSQKSSKDSSPSTPEEQLPGQHHERNNSIESVKSIHDAKVADRIVELERTLAIAKEEHNALKEELERVKQHGQVYRETIEDYRRQLPGVYSQHTRPASPIPNPVEMEYQPERSPRRLFNSRQNEDLIEQNYELRRKVAELQDEIVEQDSLYRAKLDQKMARRESEWDELTGRLHQSEKESQERLQQLLDLKHSISALTRMENQATDSDVADLTDQLYHRTREWVISNFRRTKLDLSELSPETAQLLASIYPQYGMLTSGDRLAFYQALIANTLMCIFGESMCIGLPETGPLAAIRQSATYIQDAGSEYREWCRTTIRALEKSEAKHVLEQEKEKLLHYIAGNVERLLFSLTSTKVAPSAQASLLAILHAAADLQHTLLLQKATYRINFFRINEGSETRFDEQRMEPVNDIDGMDEDGDTFAYRKFAFCVFPCLEKFGDEYGEKVEMRNVLLKARVCCGVG